VSLDGQITGPPVIAGEYLLIGAVRAGENEVVAIRLSDGSEAWSFPLDGTLRTRPVVGDGVVIVATDQGATAIALPAG
jgi:outer membrane protein assembly factor BamB